MTNKKTILTGLALLPVLAIALFFGRKEIFRQQFLHKKYIAVCEQNQGMVPHTIFLYADNTFILTVTGNLHYGRYTETGSGILFYFNDDYLEGFVCHEYRFTKTGVTLTPQCKASHENLSFARLEGTGATYN